MIKIKLCHLFLFLFLQACATPSEHFDQTAIDYHFAILTQNSSQFSHRIYVNQSALKPTGNTLHVYFDGDGSPWLHNKWKSVDPTSRNPLILELMKQDNAPALMLGRPCYHNTGLRQHCDNSLWTSHRYSREVVESMVQALKSWLLKNPYDHLVLIGYSGGGSLAMLMAPYFDKLDTVITLCANLDVDEWNRQLSR